MGEKDAKKSNKKPIFKKWWFWVIIVVVLVAIAGGSSKSEPTKVGENDSTSTSDQKVEEKTDFVVGDVISYEDKEITVVSVERNYSTGNQYLQPETGKEYVKISIKIENKSDEKLSYNSYYWEIQDSDSNIRVTDADSQFTVDDALNSSDLASKVKSLLISIFKYLKMTLVQFFTTKLHFGKIRH